MNGGPVLAVTGSNVTGDAPFSCALAIDGRVEIAAGPAGQRCDLVRLVADLCGREGIRPDAVPVARLDLGPGSYTGLRIAVTFVRFLQQFGGLRVQAVDSLSLLATRGVASARGRAIRPLLDARAERVHCAALRHDGRSGLEVVEPPRALPFADVVARAGVDDLFVVPAAAAATFGPALTEHGAEVMVARGITAGDLFTPLLAFADCRPEDLAPRYLMASYAE